MVTRKQGVSILVGSLIMVATFSLEELIISFVFDKIVQVFTPIFEVMTDPRPVSIFYRTIRYTIIGLLLLSIAQFLKLSKDLGIKLNRYHLVGMVFGLIVLELVHLFFNNYMNLV